MLLFICLGLLALVAVVVLIDLVPLFADWQGRIHIGRYTDRQKWGQKVSERGSEWLTNTPKIKVTDNTRLIFIDMLRGNYTKSAIQHWQEASLLLGLTEYIKKHGDLAAKAQVKTYLDKTFDQHGQWRDAPKHVDGAILAYAVMKLDDVDTDRYKPAYDAIWNMIQGLIGEDGTVMYRSFMKPYRYVDTIGFICPFLIAYGIRYQVDDCVRLAVKQIHEYEQKGMLKQQHIPCHAYNITTNMPLGLYGWGRGLGWYAIGLIDAWSELPENHELKSRLQQSVETFTLAVLKQQQASGAWNWTVTRSEARADSSTTATLAWFLLQASEIEGLEMKCKEAVDRAVSYLMQVTRRNGAVDFSQGDTKDIGVYAMLFNILPFTQGFCIRIVNRIT